MNVMLLTFGPNTKNHYQACFAILTMLKAQAKPAITVYTDVPEFYASFGDSIHIEYTSPELLQQWRGEQDFFWRIKCKAVQHMVQRHPGEHVVYIDSDTFLAAELDGIKQLLDNGVCLMHECEGRLCELGSKTESAMWHALRDGKFNDVKINEHTAMWNAGVIAIPGQVSQQVADHAVQLCDSLCATKAPWRLLEQFAFSLALAHGGQLQPAADWIGHYWGNKEDWNAAIAEFYLTSKLKARTLDDDLAALDEFDFSAIALRRKTKSSKARVKAWLDRIMPDKTQQYFSR
jgi:hypothetical protein